MGTILKSVAIGTTNTYVAGKFGNALSADGTTNSRVQIEGFALTAGTNYTWSFWMKSTSATSLNIIFPWGGSNYIAMALGKLRINYNGSGNLTGTTTINNNVWHHIEVGFSGSGMIAFVDGVQELSNAIVFQPALTTDNPLTVFNLSNASFYNGQIDDLALWNTQLHTANFTPPTIAADTADSNLISVVPFDATAIDAADGTVHISPNNAAILYSPYTWDVSSTTATTICTGSYFKVCFTGNSVTLRFDMQYLFTPYPQIYVRVDGVNYSWQRFVLASSIVVTMPADTLTSAASHYLEVFIKSATSGNNKWNGLGCAIKFKGLILQTNLKTVSAPTRQPYNILAYGDSITEGANALNSTATDFSDRNDGMTSWCNQLSMLGAEVGVVGFSSVGVTKSGAYGVPAVSTGYSLLYNNVSRSFSPVPDAIVINLGTNDTSSIATAMTTLLNNLLTATGNNTTIFVMLPFNGASAAGGASALQAAIAACNAPGKCIYVDTAGFVPTGGTTDGLHPAAWASSSQITQKVQQVIRPYLNTKRRGFAKMY